MKWVPLKRVNGLLLILRHGRHYTKGFGFFHTQMTKPLLQPLHFISISSSILMSQTLHFADFFFTLSDHERLVVWWLFIMESTIVIIMEWSGSEWMQTAKDFPTSLFCRLPIFKSSQILLYFDFGAMIWFKSFNLQSLPSRIVFGEFWYKWAKNYPKFHKMIRLDIDQVRLCFRAKGGKCMPKW